VRTPSRALSNAPKIVSSRSREVALVTILIGERAGGAHLSYAPMASLVADYGQPIDHRSGAGVGGEKLSVTRLSAQFWQQMISLDFW